MEFFLRVIADTEDTVLKEVRIKGDATMMALHEHIYTNFGLPPGEMASFYYSNANWDQGDELPMFAMDDNMPSMEARTVKQFFEASTKCRFPQQDFDCSCCSSLFELQQILNLHLAHSCVLFQSF